MMVEVESGEAKESEKESERVCEREEAIRGTSLICD